MIKCIKNNGFAQIRGNEDKIIKELLNNEYYDEWKVSKTKKYVTFELFHGDEYINFDNHHETYFKIEDTGEILVSMYMPPTNNTYYATIFSPKPESESMGMIMNAPNFIRLDINYDKYGVFSKLTLEGQTYMLHPGDILLFNEAKELTHVLQNQHYKHYSIMDFMGEVQMTYEEFINELKNKSLPKNSRNDS